MSIFYYKMWKLMEKKSIDPLPFFEDLHLAPGTVSKLKKDVPVSIEVLDRIRAALGCDYGDIITAKPQKNAIPRDALTETVEKYSDMCREALKNCMADQSLSVKNVMEITTLSRNTIKEFLNGGDISSRSFLKLIRMDEFKEELSRISIEAGILPMT